MASKPYSIAGREYPSQYAYRKALAQSKGFAGVSAYQTNRTAERTLEKLSGSGKRAYHRALEAVQKARTQGLSLSQAAKQSGTTVKSVQKYANSALTKQGNTYQVKEHDFLARQMRLVTPDGVERVLIRDSREASLLGRYYNALQKFQETGDASVLKAFEGKTVTVRGEKVTLVTDPSTLNNLSRAGELDIPDVYERSLS